MKKLKRVFSSDLGKSISSGYLLFFLNNVVALFLTPYMLRYISKEEYGLYIMCVDFLAWVGFLEFGTSKVLESKAAHLIAQNNFNNLNTSFNTSLFFQIVVSIIIFPLFFSLIYWGVDKPNVNHLEIVIILFSLTASLTVFRNLFSSVIVASKKIHLDNKIQIFTNVLNYILILLLAPYIGVVGLASITLFTLILMLIRSNFRVKQLFPQIHISFRSFDWDELKKIFSLGFYFSLGSIATVLLLKIDSFVIGREFGLATVASFYITIKLYTLLQKVFQILLNNFRPHIAQMYGKMELGRIKDLYFVMFYGAYSFGILGLASVQIINQFFIKHWVGKTFYIGDEFNTFYGVWILLDLLTLPSRIVLNSSLVGIKSLSYARLAEAFTRIGIIFLLLTSNGLNILPISSILACLIFGISFQVYLMKGYFEIKNTRFILSNILPVAFILAILFSLYMFKQVFYFKYLFFFAGLVFVMTYLYRYSKRIRSLI
ncbi:lipopolysaccharide biosynthesis protein [Sphingobacterium multivorum]|uniref:lipopolysaccharide biosynthesis protein n=1 Tax=Sphingobacterium multivorum TaxID=28454 RepID=UPI0028B07926|nr:oligosaccharide flippase family protein [Sphingobacterium multivorum]